MVDRLITNSQNLFYFAKASILDRDDLNIPLTDLSSDSKITDVLTIIFGLLGGLAVIIIIIGGIKFILSQGDPAATAKARNTIIYAAIGLAVSVGGFSIVSFVVGKL